MPDEKRMIEGYEVKHAVQLGGGEVILAENKAAAEPYLVCDCSWDNPFGVDEYKNGIVSDDFLEVMKEFTTRLTTRVEAVEAERIQRGLPHKPLTAADCIPKSTESHYEGHVVVIKPEKLSAECRSADFQLGLCTGGNGARFNAIGRAVFCTNLYTGKSARRERVDIAGIISPDKLPEWAKEKLDALQKPAEKASVVEAIKVGRDTSQPKTSKKHNKSGPEL